LIKIQTERFKVQTRVEYYDSIQSQLIEAKNKHLTFCNAALELSPVSLSSKTMPLISLPFLFCEITEIKDFKQLDEVQVKAVALSFQGDIEQVPPMYSALKKDGQPLYKLARQGIEIERKARLVTIHKLDFLGYENGIISLEVSCSKGTYIRSLIADIGDKLGCGAHVIELRRIGFAHVDIAQTLKFVELEALASDDFTALDAKIFKSEDLLPNIHSVSVDQQQGIDIRYGRKIKIENQVDSLVKMFDENAVFLGIGQIECGYLQPKRLFI
jgi:tRNA pseudouridine55 synthase